MSTIKAPEMIKRPPTSRSTDRDTCYVCRQKGHWASDCPQKSNKRSSSSLPSAGTFFNDQDFPEMQCPCGAGICPIQTSKTTKNPDRKFYCCPNSSTRRCEFFRWCDTVTCNGVPNVVESSYPTCSRGAGKCSLPTGKDGKDAGRKSFASPVKKEKRKSHNKPPKKCESQNNPIIKDVEIMASGCDANLGSNSGVANYYEDQKAHNTYTQTGGGINNPQIQGVKKISNKGNFNNGSFNKQGASGGVVRYLGYTPGIFIAVVFGILLMWMYGYF